MKFHFFLYFIAHLMLMCVAFAFAVAVLATFLATDSILQLCGSVG